MAVKDYWEFRAALRRGERERHITSPLSIRLDSRSRHVGTRGCSRHPTITRVRRLARKVAEAWMKQREEMGFPLLKGAAK